MLETLNKDLEYLDSTTISEETTEEVDTTTSEEITEEVDTTTSEEITEEVDTTTSGETTEEVVIYSEVGYDALFTEMQLQTSLMHSNYDMLTFIFIVLLFILFKSYIVHFLEYIRTMGK